MIVEGPTPRSRASSGRWFSSGSVSPMVILQAPTHVQMTTAPGLCAHTCDCCTGASHLPGAQLAKSQTRERDNTTSTWVAAKEFKSSYLNPKTINSIYHISILG